MKAAIGNIMMNAWAALILVVLVLGPLYFMHGYRQWWVIIFYALAGAGTIAGIFSHYVLAGRNRKSEAHHGAA